MLQCGNIRREWMLLLHKTAREIIAHTISEQTHLHKLHRSRVDNQNFFVESA